MTARKIGGLWVDYDELLACTDLVQLFGETKILCPSHDDSRPSMHVYPDHAYCFVCGKYLSAIDVVKLMTGLEYKGAVQYLMANKGKCAPVRGPVSPLDAEPIMQLHQTLVSMKSNSIALSWLYERGIDMSMIEAFRLGWTGRAYSIPHFVNGGIENVKYRVHPAYLMAGEPKYNSLPGRDFKHLYPWDFFRRVCGRETEKLYLVEGEFDGMLLLSGLPLPTLSVPSGVNTDWRPWITFLRRFKEIHLLFDQDAAGNEAAEKLFTKKDATGKTIEALLLPTLLLRRTWPIEWGKDITDARHSLLPIIRREYDSDVRDAGNAQAG